MISHLSSTHRRLLTLLQSEFPLTSDPFVTLAERFGDSASVLRRRVADLIESRYVRGIHGVFDSTRLGYHSTLVAARVGEEKIDHAAEIINAHPGVSHNYGRQHEYNLWFTLTAPIEKSLDEAVAALMAKAGVEHFRLLPALRVFKIGVHFDVERGVATAPRAPRSDRQDEPAALMPEDRVAVRALQDNLPLTEHPFQELARSYGLSEETLLAKAVTFKTQGTLRRYGALLRHRKSGFTANGMSCWVVPAEDVGQAGAMMSRFSAVSHCYERPTYPDWPYNVFAMIHGKDESVVEQIVGEIAEATDLRKYAVLYSDREFKKESLRFFREI